MPENGTINLKFLQTRVGVSEIPQKDGNLILFPKTIDYHRRQLSLMLEGERYGEAIRALQELIEMRIGNVAVMEEWQGLLDYLRVMFPDGQAPDSDETDFESEEEVLQAHIAGRDNQDGEYAEQLIRIFEAKGQLERQIAALDQLRYVRHPRVGETVRGWLCEHQLPPGIQFKALQLLKMIGESGSVPIRKQGGTYIVEIRETPASQEELPSSFAAVAERIQSVSAIRQPELASFAEELWREFIAYIYGTPTYNSLSQLDMEQTDIWAAALHISLLKIVHGFADATEICEQYGITGEMKPDWQSACDMFRSFMLTGWTAGQPT